MSNSIFSEIKTTISAVVNFFNRNSHRCNLALLLLLYWTARILALHPVDERGDAIFKWRIIRLWYETGSYPAIQPEHHQGRWMIMLPVRAIVELFGTDPWVYYIYPLIIGMVAAVAVYFIASRLQSKAAGVLSFVLITFVPSLARESMQLLPLIPATAFTMLAVLAMLRYFDTRRVLWTLAAGFLLAFGYGCKITMAYWYIPFALGILLYRPYNSDGKRPFPWLPLILLSVGMITIFTAEIIGFRAAFGVPYGRISMITSGHLSNRPSPQYLNLGEYLLSFRRPMLVRGDFVYAFITVTLTFIGAVSSVMLLLRRDTTLVKRFASLCVVWVYLLHCYVVYKVFPFLHPERNHDRYLLALFALECVMAVCAFSEWRKIFGIFSITRPLPWFVWFVTLVFVIIATINPIIEGRHIGRFISHRKLLFKDKSPVILQIIVSRHKPRVPDRKFARMYVSMFATTEDVKQIHKTREFFTDKNGNIYMLLWGKIPEGPCKVRICKEIFCKSKKLNLKRLKKL